MKIALYSVSSGKVVNSIVEKFFKLNDKYNLQFYIESRFAKKINSEFNVAFNTFQNHSDLDKSIDLIVTIGGEGT